VLSPALIDDAARLLESCKGRSFMLATAESCTGGLVSALLTAVPGSSAVVDRGFVTYSNAAKIEMLGVHGDLLQRHGAVSAEVARAMAEGALLHSEADVAVAVTGVAGPDGGTPRKPVGLVYLAAARIGASTLVRELRYGALDRATIREQAAADALSLAREAVEKEDHAAIE
jgi:nicotinamide-nucleotide amidase